RFRERPAAVSREENVKAFYQRLNRCWHGPGNRKALVELQVLAAVRSCDRCRNPNVSNGEVTVAVILSRKVSGIRSDHTNSPLCGIEARRHCPCELACGAYHVRVDGEVKVGASVGRELELELFDVAVAVGICSGPCNVDILADKQGLAAVWRGQVHYWGMIDRRRRRSRRQNVDDSRLSAESVPRNNVRERSAE